MGESFDDPKWVKFEQLDRKTIVRPRSDFVFRFSQDFEVGVRSKVGDIVYNAADGLIYRNIQETKDVAPDYSNANSNLYWAWIAGSLSGFVAGRGWWIKFADGRCFQHGAGSNGTNYAGALGKYYKTSTHTLPIALYSVEAPIASNAEGDVPSNNSWLAHCTCTTTTLTVFHGAYNPANNAATDYYWNVWGRWKA